MDVIDDFSCKYAQLKKKGLQVTSLCDYLIQTWKNLVKIHDELRKDKNYRNKILKQVNQEFLHRLDELDLMQEQALVVRRQHYREPYLSDVILEFANSPISFQIPYSFYMFAYPELVPLITNRLEDMMLSQESPSKDHSPVLDAKMFLSWLFEENRKLPLALSRLDILILQTVSNLSYFQDAHVLHSAKRVIMALNMRERDRSTIERRMRYLKESCAWRPKFGNNLAPMGFKTFYIEWNQRNKWLKKEMPHSQVALLDVHHPQFDCGIYQIPLHWRLADVIEEIGGTSLDTMCLSLNLSYLNPDDLAPYQRKRIASADFPITINPRKKVTSTNMLEYPLIPDWDNSSQLTNHMISMVKFFSAPNVSIGRHTTITKELRISRVLFSRYLRNLVEMKILYYFPQFIKIGMDARVIIIFREALSSAREAMLSGMSRAPRMLSFNGPDVSLAFLNVGPKQVSLLVRSVKKLQKDFDIVLLPNLVSGEHYTLQNVPFHRFDVKRRDDDKKLLYYLKGMPEQLVGRLPT